ncbi:MAG: ABC transporter ATP-binding protein [Solirubrobacteraceae bacterium]|nr:ABC transporter ATP-binding protein [Solirubrobacteraceae bacterium]
MKPPAPILDVRDLRVTFSGRGGRINALRGMSLQIQPGEVVGLVGESGSGKSVLGLTALGLLAAASDPQVTGSVQLDGFEMVGASPEGARQRRGTAIGAVFQDPMGSLNPVMKIGRQVAESAGGASDEEVAAMLEATGIRGPAAVARCFPHELSGGMRQRVMIAMALARHPKLIIADEPTTALDVTVQAKVLDLLATTARERGVALLLVTHDLGVAARICDRIAVAYAGRIVEQGTTEEILDGPRHPYALGLLASRPRLDGAVRGGLLPTLPGSAPDPTSSVVGCAFASRCPAADGACLTPVPEAHEDGRLVACHHPGELTTWPDRAAQVIKAAVAESAADGLAARKAGDPRTPAVVATGLVREFDGRRSGMLGRRGPALRAVGGIDLTVPAGGSVAIVGESGSGKSTLLRMIVGLLEPTEGTVRLAPGPSPQMVFQDAGASLTPWMSVGEHLAERLAAVGMPKREHAAAIDRALHAVGLPVDAAARRPAQLSGGQRQRAAIARAIVVPPPLIACDEPVSALDVSLAAQVLNLLCDLRQQLGLALLFVTHDLAAARAVADEVVVMQGGLVIERAPTDQLFTAPSHDYTRELIAAVPEAVAA